MNVTSNFKWTHEYFELLTSLCLWTRGKQQREWEKWEGSGQGGERKGRMEKGKV